MLISNTNKKSFVLALLSATVLIASMWALSVPFHESKNIYYWLSVLALLVASLNVLSFSFLFPFSKRIPLALAGLAGLSVLLFFPFVPLQVLTALIVTAGVLQMSRSIVKARNENLHFSFYESTKTGMMVFLVSLLFLVSFNVYDKTAESIKQDPQLFYENVSGAVVKSVQPLLESKVDAYSTDITIDEFLNNSRTFENEPDDMMVQDLTLEERRERLLGLFGVQASGQEQLSNVLKGVVLVRVQEIFEPIKTFVPFFYALLLFLSLRFLLPVLIWISGGLGVLLYRLIKKIGWIRMTIQTVEVENPELS